jgi:hypothetical protein
MRALLLVLLPACGSDDGSCPVIESGADRVVVGFWETSDCSGEPVATNSFPTSGEADCYCWPGSSGENSADAFTCGEDGGFTYTQYGSLDCGLSDDTPVEKTVYADRCQQDIPPTIYTMLLDAAACQ